MLAIIIKNSILIVVLKKALNIIRYHLGILFRHSLVCRLINTLLLRAKAGLKYSFLGKITEDNEYGDVNKIMEKSYPENCYLNFAIT